MNHDVFPTRVGMDRRLDSSACHIASFPHARGDGPLVGPPPAVLKEFSPRAWGWTVVPVGEQRRAAVFPTRVGMDRSGLAVFRRE